MKKLSMFLMAVFVLLGCSTPYQPLKRGTISPGGGYASKQIGEKEFELVFGGNGFSSRQRVADFWHRRAKELCGSEDYTPSLAISRVNGFPSAKGTVKCH